MGYMKSNMVLLAIAILILILIYILIKLKTLNILNIFTCLFKNEILSKWSRFKSNNSSHLELNK